ncbi:MAG: cell envelope integrity protein CreD [Cryomorphaceae bacterium]|nr:cell envelope integrity protein CreD [Cryomorphaceae bacterium]
MSSPFPQPPSTFEKFQKWISESTGIKLFTIFILTLLLLIPSGQVKDLIHERQQNMFSAINEVSQKWAGNQQFSGPVLIIPYHEYRKVKKGDQIHEEKVLKNAFFFPEELKIDGELFGKSLKRGIFDVVVYNADLDIQGRFGQLNISKLGLDSSQMLWDKARLHFSIDDMRGIREIPVLMVEGKQLETESNTTAPSAISPGISSLPQTLNGDFSFSIHLSMKGSRSLSFLPLGKSTIVNLKGDWKDPKFDGNFLPDTRNVTDTGFYALWKIFHFNRSFGQAYTETFPNISQSKFGVNLIMPVDQYQQSIRTAKYALLIIVLTFLSLFLIESFAKKFINALQYILIGLALVLYYSLLIGLSEHLGFNTAYLISSIATSILVGAYVWGIFRSIAKGVMITALLSVFYVFIFVITKAQDYALLIGNVGLFIALGAVMYATARFKSKKETD